MFVARIGALVLLAGLAFAAAQVGQLVFPVAAEGYGSWLPLLIFLAPAGLLATLSAVLVLMRRPLGLRLAAPLAALVAVTALVAVAGLPPVGAFVADYERAALVRGVEVPTYRAEQGWTPRRYVEERAWDARVEGAVGAVGAAAVYLALARVGLRLGARRVSSSPA